MAALRRAARLSERSAMLAAVFHRMAAHGGWAYRAHAGSHSRCDGSDRRAQGGGSKAPKADARRWWRGARHACVARAGIRIEARNVGRLARRKDVDERR